MSGEAGAALAAALCAASVAALLWAERRGHRGGVWIAKPLASLCFLLAGTAFGALESGYGRLVLLGLALCAAGDALLIPRERQGAFLAGIGAFLLGHVAYTVGFLSLGIDPTALGIAGVLMVAFALRVLRWLDPHVPPDFRVPVHAYVAVISAMVACAVAAAAAGGPARAAAGALAFAASDLAVARDRFVTPAFANAAWGLPLYYASQLVLAWSVRHALP